MVWDSWDSAGVPSQASAASAHSSCMALLNARGLSNGNQREEAVWLFASLLKVKKDVTPNLFLSCWLLLLITCLMLVTPRSSNRPLQAWCTDLCGANLIESFSDDKAWLMHHSLQPHCTHALMTETHCSCNIVFSYAMNSWPIFWLMEDSWWHLITI